MNGKKCNKKEMWKKIENFVKNWGKDRTKTDFETIIENIMHELTTFLSSKSNAFCDLHAKHPSRVRQLWFWFVELQNIFWWLAFGDSICPSRAEAMRCTPPIKAPRPPPIMPIRIFLLIVFYQIFFLRCVLSLVKLENAAKVQWIRADDPLYNDKDYSNILPELADGNREFD